MGGLPRSGSTLLSSLLNQNPDIHSGPSTPVLSTMIKLEEHLSQDELYLSYPKQKEAEEIISNVINHYYSDVDKPIVVDKCRQWTVGIGHIKKYIDPNPKVILTVRDVGEVVASFVRMIHRNPWKEGQEKMNFIDSSLIKLDRPINNRERCMMLVNEGVIGSSLEAIREMMADLNNYQYIHFVEYNDLVNHPQVTMSKLYKFLELEEFEHDFDNICNVHREKDQEQYGLADMHYVRPKLGSTAPDPSDVVPPDLLEECKALNFWRETPHVEHTVKVSPNYQPTQTNPVIVL